MESLVDLVAVNLVDLVETASFVGLADLSTELICLVYAFVDSTADLMDVASWEVRALLRSPLTVAPFIAVPDLVDGMYSM